MKDKSPLLIGFEGTELNNSLESHLKSCSPAGIILFKRNIVSVEQTRKLISDIKNLLGDIIISVDHEGGVVNRFPEDCPVPPSPFAMSKVGDTNMLEKACQVQAELIDHIGFNLNFAPVLDLFLEERNEAIGTRAYSENPTLVARYGEICIKAHKALGIGTTAKHFPGHGRTILDSHFAAGEVKHLNDRQLEDDLFPFKQAISHDVEAFMTAHLCYPMLDPDNPASFSKKILKDLLQTELGFNGLIISDCVEMAGIGKVDTPEEIAKKGLSAGLDLLISAYSIKRSYEFQLQLAKACQNWIKENPNQKDDICKKTGFIKNKVFLDNTPKSLQDPISTIAIHRKSLEKVREIEMKNPPKKMLLLELNNQEFKGVNVDNSLSGVGQQIFDGCPSMIEYRVNHKCDFKALEKSINHCKTETLMCVLLTFNGFKQPNYQQFIQKLQSMEHIVHIALLEADDLSGIWNQEWVTWGCNFYTGKMLAEELKRLI